MPVFWFALSFVESIDWVSAAIIFFVLHFLVYPSSNGYNSFMDRDEGSIGGIEKPPPPTNQLFVATIVLDTIAIAFSLLISLWFTAAVLVYIIFSRLYSYRAIRLKRFAIAGYLTVIANQGALTFFMVYHGASINRSLQLPWQGWVASAFLIGGFYPITQVYQHEADARDGVKTISMLLGVKGTFIFCAFMYGIALGLLFIYYGNLQQLGSFLVLQLCFIPVIVFFVRWFIKVWHNKSIADFKHTMQMNWLASTCTSLAFITLIILHQIG